MHNPCLDRCSTTQLRSVRCCSVPYRTWCCSQSAPTDRLDVRSGPAGRRLSKPRLEPDPTLSARGIKRGSGRGRFRPQATRPSVWLRFANKQVRCRQPLRQSQYGLTAHSLARRPRVAIAVQPKRPNVLRPGPLDPPPKWTRQLQARNTPRPFFRYLRLLSVLTSLKREPSIVFCLTSVMTSATASLTLPQGTWRALYSTESALIAS